MSRKLAPRYVGPYTISQVIKPSALRLTLPPSLKIHPVFHVSQVKLVASCPVSACLCPTAALCPRGRQLGLGGQLDPGGLSPRTGIPLSGGLGGLLAWVPRSYLADPSLLEDFYKANPSAIGRSPGVSHREGGPVAGAAVAMPTSLPARSGERAGSSIINQAPSNSTCNTSTRPTKARRDQHSGQKCS